MHNERVSNGELRARPLSGTARASGKCLSTISRIAAVSTFRRFSQKKRIALGPIQSVLALGCRAGQLKKFKESEWNFPGS